MKKISLIISVYRNIKYLDIVLLSLDKQDFKDFEVIIAEDNNGSDMVKFITEQRKKHKYEIKHVWQEHDGFRKNKILNEAIKKADGDYLVFIDGDCVLHKKFLKNCARYASEEKCLFGRRVSIPEQTVEKILKDRSLKYFNLINLIINKAGFIEESIYIPFGFLNPSKTSGGIYGCNFCLSKKNMIKINGFDEDFNKPYFGEDTDVERRLGLLGVKMKSIRYKAIQYHLEHPKLHRDNAWEDSKIMYEKKIEENKYYCSNGIIKGEK